MPIQPTQTKSLSENLRMLENEIDKIATQPNPLDSTIPREPALLRIRPVLQIVGDRDRANGDLKAIGSRVAYLARRLRCKPYPVDPTTDAPYKRGIYLSDGDAPFDLIEVLNKLLDYLGCPE